MAPVVTLVPHTHWDREWYEPFQRFRLRLVRLMDEVLARAEAEPGFCFTMDGQMAAVDDYLEVRPENRDRVAGLVRQGRLAVGPWQILLDEFLCSGENIVRNLEHGYRAAQSLGAVMPVGYLPDMFGHCAQMPQILARAGLRHACVWRGVPAEVTTHAFCWVAPDGSSVRTEYLPGGYGNGVDLFAVPDALADAVANHHAQAMKWFGDDPVLAMFGTDHSAPLPGLMDLVRGLGDDGTPWRLSVRTLSDYVTAYDADADGLLAVQGELRSHARANVLPGVISVRGHLKQAMAAAERMVERYAEPMSALWSRADHDRFLDMAWRRLIDASCHDSVTGCGVDETAVQVEARVAEAEHLGQAVRDQVLAELAAEVPTQGYVVLNPSPVQRTALVELDVAAPDESAPVRLEVADAGAVPVQELSRTPQLLADETFHAGDLGTLLARIHGRELYGQQIERAEIGEGEITFHVAHAPEMADFDPGALKASVRAVGQAHPGPWRLRIVAEPRRRVLASVPVPPLGRVSVVPAGTSAEVPDRVEVTDETGLTNGRVSVEVEPTGTLTVLSADGTTLTGVGRLVDGGDRGDSYNWGRPAHDLLVDEPADIKVEVLEPGPLRAVLAVERTYTWPVGLVANDHGHRSPEHAKVPVRTLVELHAGEPFVRLDVSFRNPSANHRLRLHIPLPERVDHTDAEGQFAVTQRGLTAEGGCGEEPLPTFPASSFVSAGAAHVLLDQVTEYELVDDGTELALTLLRSVGMLSVNAHPSRDEPAGPQLPVPEAQRVGQVVSTRLAVLPYAGDWRQAKTAAAAEVFRHSLVAAAGQGGSRATPPQHGLSVQGDGVVMTSLRQRTDAREVRMVAMTNDSTTARVEGDFATVTRVDLLGTLLEDPAAAAGEFELTLRPWEIATVRLGP